MLAARRWSLWPPLAVIAVGRVTPAVDASCEVEDACTLEAAVLKGRDAAALMASSSRSRGGGELRGELRMASVCFRPGHACILHR